ncbi:MAG: hypothetical protein IJR20_06745 [Muribaculaceae bacterium]|nr:hypothetical protein [Muribaculaceae bacterium]
MKKLLITLMCLVGIFSAQAQIAEVKKQVVTVEPFVNNGNLSSDNVNRVRNEVVQSLTATGRVIVFDKAQQGAVAAEQERSKKTAADMRDMGEMGQYHSDKIVTGSVNAATITRKQREVKDYVKKTSHMETYYEASFSYQINIVDPNTGVNTYSNVFTASATGETESVALNNALGAVGVGSKDFVEANFGLAGQIVQVYKTNKNNTKAEEVYINLGSSHGIAKGNRLKAYAQINVAGEMSNKEIGELEVKEVASGSRALCKVKKGGEDIIKLMSENATINVESYAHHGFFERGIFK